MKRMAYNTLLLLCNTGVSRALGPFARVIRQLEEEQMSIGKRSIQVNADSNPSLLSTVTETTDDYVLI